MRPRGLSNKRCLDLRGKQFGNLSPIEVDTSRRDRVYWLCRCVCGKIKSVASKHLTIGMVSSCGCQQYKCGKQSHSWNGYEDISKKYWEALRRNAKKRGFEFSITPSYAWEIYLRQNKSCALTGLPIQFKSRSDVSDGTASLDRIDSTRGYIKGNVWWVDKTVNTIKWDLPLDNFLKTCKLVAEHNKL